MKVLFVDKSQELEKKWVEPLRESDWAVIRARSTEDAQKMCFMHGDSISLIIVSENFVTWAEKQNLPFVVLTQNWKKQNILNHQNGEFPAIAYLDFDSKIDLLINIFGEDGAPRNQVQSGQEVALEDYKTVLTRSEISVNQENEIHFEAPDVQLGGGKVDGVEQLVVSEVQEVVFDNQFEQSDKTTILDTTKRIDHDIAHEEFQDHRMDLPIEKNLVQEPLLAIDELTDESYGNLALKNFEIEEFPQLEVATKNENSSDIETLRRYLSLREQDVAVMSGQMRSQQSRIEQLEMALKVEKARNSELIHMISKQEKKIKDYDNEKRVEFQVLFSQVEDLNLQLKEKSEKARTIEAKLKLSVDEISQVKDRVRVDIRRIRVREKELESQLEVIKKDSVALLQARDEKILELKRKIDLLEFNMELIQEQFAKEKKASEELRLKLKDASKMMQDARLVLDHNV